jgi:hypothetical protein
VERHEEVGRREDEEQPDREVGSRHQKGGHPGGLDDQQADHIAHRRRTSLRVAGCGPQPHQHQADPHDDVADDAEREVGLEDARDPGGEHQ